MIIVGNKTYSAEIKIVDLSIQGSSRTLTLLSLQSYNLKRQRMGASCVGKVKSKEPLKPQTKENTLSSELPSNEDLPCDPKRSPLPSIHLPFYSLCPKPNPNIINIRPESLLTHKEYRYIELVQFSNERYISSRTVADFSEWREEQPSDCLWSQCSTLQKDLDPSLPSIIINGTAYTKIIQSSGQTPNISPIVEQRQIQLKLAPHTFPRLIAVINIEARFEEGFKYSQKTYSISHYEQVQIISQEIMQTHPSHESFSTPYLSGIVFSQRPEPKQSSPFGYLAQLLGLKNSPNNSTVIMLYANKEAVSSQLALKGTLSKYFEVSNFVKEHSESIWSSSLSSLQKVTEGRVLNCFLSIQFLRCIIDGFERESFSNSTTKEARENLGDKRGKLIQKFLMLDKIILKPFYFIANAFLLLQGLKEAEVIESKIKQLLQSIGSCVSLMSDGIFHEFGFEINQKQHPISLQPYSLLRLKGTNKSIRHISKSVVSPSYQIVNRIKESLVSIAHQTETLTSNSLDQIWKTLMETLEKDCKELLNISINVTYAEDAFLRLRLLRVYLSLSQGSPIEEEWKAIQSRISSLETITQESALFYLIVGSLASTCLREGDQRTQVEENFYFKAVELSHKIYGDPRSSRMKTSICPEQIWESLLLDNYCALFKGPLEKKELLYLLNIKECLMEDLRDILPPSEGSSEFSLTSMGQLLHLLPIRSMSGIFYKRSSILDNHDDARSNYSQSLSSTSSKRTSRASYKINESQFSIKLSSYSGILRWGGNNPIAPYIFPPLKNKQILAIACGNYHTVFLTQEGIYGWGENHSYQLGAQNKEKIYLKEVVQIKSVPIHRDRDRFQISCGNQHTAFLLNGELMMWGQLEGGITSGNGAIFDSVNCGGLHTLAIRDGVVFSWGRGEGGQLGHPLALLKQKRKEETTEFYVQTPTAIKSIPERAVKVVCGDAHSLVLTVQGKVYVFGFCYQGQLGLGVTGDSQNFQIFQPIEQSFFKEKVVDIFAGPTFSFFKTERGDVFSCGINDCLQLGIDRVLKVFQKKKYLNRTVEMGKKRLGEQQFSKPRRIETFSSQFNLQLSSIECGENHCLAQARYMGQEVLIGWGLNRQFQIDSQLGETVTPRILDFFYNVPVKAFTCANNFSLAQIGSIPMTHREFSRLLNDSLNGVNHPQI